MLKNRDEINKKEHHTDLYDNVKLIVRRGQPFQIKLTFNRPYNPDKDQFCIEFLVGGSPQVSKGTYIPVFPNQEQVKGEWGGRILQSADNVVTLSITPAADSILEKFRMYVAIMTPYGIRRTTRDPERDIYILFNPWCEDDSVCLDNEAERNEYVLNDVGTIYYGEASNVETRPWIFGQFEYGVLDACLYVMDSAQMLLTGRKDPVKVSRVASAMVNSDVVYWKRMRDGTQQPIKVNKHHVGQMVLIKEVGRDEIKNITDLYKFPEASNLLEAEQATTSSGRGWDAIYIQARCIAAHRAALVCARPCLVLPSSPSLVADRFLSQLD
ncbi:UNVERIFIED_CONTAM: hypothetical protein FKN15_054119 [Acipenser sinensis]